MTDPPAVDREPGSPRLPRNVFPTLDLHPNRRAGFSGSRSWTPQTGPAREGILPGRAWYRSERACRDPDYSAGAGSGSATGAPASGVAVAGAGTTPGTTWGLISRVTTIAPKTKMPAAERNAVV